MGTVPLLGLNDTVIIYSKTTTSGTYGGTTTAEVEHIAAYKCRRTEPPGALQDLLEIQAAGGVMEKNWFWIGEYKSTIVEGMLLKDGSNMYKIVKVIPRRNAAGQFHHLKLKTKLVDDDG